MDTKNILVIGDTHAPFEHRDYLQFCKDVAKKYKTTHTIHIGDVIDSHYSSYHETNPDGWGAGDELEAAIKNLKAWHKAFPGADVMWGNHDRIVIRKLVSSGLSQKWMRSINEVLEVPSWNFYTSRTYDGVLYVHGEGVTARTKAQRTGKSVVQGHRHSESYVWYHPRDFKTHFGMQVGCGIDADSYAFGYAKDHPAPVLSCGVVLNNGQEAIVVPMR